MATPVTALLDGKLVDDDTGPGILTAERLQWNMLAGGIPFANDFEQAKQQANMRPPRGVFAEVPGATPKYAVNDGTVDGDFRESLARLFLPVKNYDSFIKEFETKPETQRIAKVLGGTVDSEGNTSGGNGYIDFLLQNVQHTIQEKSQIIETLADEHIAYFFGQGAAVFTYSGTLLNTKQDDQAMNMLRLYNEMGRGTKLAQRNTLLSIRYDGLIVSGAMLGLSLGLNAEMEMAVPFNFSLLVKQIVQLPSPNASVVQLSKPFAIKGDGYLPFNQGLSGLGTTSVKVTAVPPVASAPEPAAAQKQPEPGPSEREKAREQKKLSHLQQSAAVQTTSTVAQQAPEVNQSTAPVSSSSTQTSSSGGPS